MKLIGRKDKIDIPEFGLYDIPAKIDTGANRSSIHCSEIELHNRNGIEEITFHIPLDTSHGINTFHTSTFFKKKIKSSSGHVENRYIIRTTVILFGKKIKTTFSLSDRAEMKFPVLLGRKLLKSRFIVDVDLEDISYNEKIKKNENSSIVEKS